MKYIIMLSLALLFVTNCGDNPPVTQAPPPTAQEIAHFQLASHVFKGPCTESNLVFSYEYDGAYGVNARITAYDDGCVTPILTVSRMATFTLAAPNADGDFPIDLSFNKFLLAINNQDFVDSVNGGGGVCGNTDPYVINVDNDITAGAPDCLGDLARSLEYQLLRVSATVIYGGLEDDDHNGSTPELRPVSIDLTVPYTRQ